MCVVDTGRKLPPVSTTQAKLMAKFAVGVVDTGPPVSLIPVVHLDLRISKKFKTVLVSPRADLENINS
jgi:hypothetical protein